MQWKNGNCFLNCLDFAVIMQVVLRPNFQIGKPEELKGISTSVDNFGKKRGFQNLQNLMDSLKVFFQKTELLKQMYSETVEWCTQCAKPCCSDHKQVTLICDYCAD